jgi:biopolymer transport protein ExbB
VDFNIVEKLLGIMSFGTAWVLWLLIILSIVSVTIMLERIVFFSRMRLDFPGFIDALTKKLIDNDDAGVKKLCEQSHSLEAQIVLKGYEHRANGPKAMRESMEGLLVGSRQIMDRGLVILGTLGNNAPFIGLFGTVVGIMMAFRDMAANPAGGASVVMASISEALVATAVGLMVAIPAVIAFNAFNRVVKRRMQNAEAVMKIVLSHQTETR